MKEKQRNILEILLVSAAIAIVFYWIHQHAPNIIKILESGDLDKLDDYLDQYGTAGKYLLVVLQVIETISIVIPAMPVYICSGILFGKAAGIAICYTTNLILNILIFLTARKMKYVKSKVLNLNKQKTVRKLLDSAKHVDRVVIAMCFLPIVPNGMIPYLSAQTDIKCRDFSRALAIGSAPAIAFYVCCGDILISESYKLILFFIIVIAILAFIGFLFRKKLIVFFAPKIKKYLEG